MKYVNNEHTSHDPSVSARSDRDTFLQRRALIPGILAIPCLLIIVGVGLGTLTLPWIGALASLAILLPVFFFNSYLLKDNPRLRKASRWTFRSYRESVKELDEREKLVIDQAFRTSYRILALVCSLLMVCLFFINNNFHLAYRLGSSGSYCIGLGVLCLLQYLPTTVVAWHERG